MGKNKRKVLLSENESLLVELHAIVKSRSDSAFDANSLICWFMANKFWTPKQINFAKALTVKHARQLASKKKPKKYWLYAMSDGDAIKLGFSSNIQKRRGSMQTGAAQSISVIWKYYVGTLEDHARSCERKLHRLCKDHHVRGEWFNAECMELVSAFSCEVKTIMLDTTAR